MKIAVFVTNRTTFPQSIVQDAISEVTEALKRNGVTPLVPPFTVSNDAEGIKYAAYLAENPCDGVIAVFPNFGDESSCFTALRDAGVPIMFQAYPDALDAMGPATRRDAFCGKVSAVNLFRQGQIPCSCFAPHTVHPNSVQFDKNICDFKAVCRIVKGMKRVRTGSIGTRCTPFKTVRFDETTLERYGISNEAFDLSEVLHRYHSCNDDDAVKLADSELEKLSFWPAGSEDVRLRLARLTAVIRSMIEEYRLDLITLRCWTELEKELKCSPCVILSLLNSNGIVANCEVDTVNALLMRLLSLASDTPAACLDWNNNYGDEEDQCVLFHCGPTAAQLMRERGKVSDHAMLATTLGKGNCIGCNEGRMKPGVFTCASGLTRDGKLKIFVDRGRFLEEDLPKEFFGCGGIAEFENFQQKMLNLLRWGFPHHVSLSYGDNLAIVREAVESYLGYEVIGL